MVKKALRYFFSNNELFDLTMVYDPHNKNNAKTVQEFGWRYPNLAEFSRTFVYPMIRRLKVNFMAQEQAFEKQAKLWDNIGCQLLEYLKNSIGIHFVIHGLHPSDFEKCVALCNWLSEAQGSVHCL